MRKAVGGGGAQPTQQQPSAADHGQGETRRQGLSLGRDGGSLRGALRQKRRPRQFSSVEHLSPEAVAAFVDEELSPGATHRARVHLVHCVECRREVFAQRGAAEELHRSNARPEVQLPSTLLDRLNNIAATGGTPGPSAEACDRPLAEDFFDVVETVLRSLKRR